MIKPTCSVFWPQRNLLTFTTISTRIGHPLPFDYFETRLPANH